MKKIIFTTTLIFSLFNYVSAQVTVSLPPLKDNTLYQSTTGSLSNALGGNIFSGRTNSGSRRRALIKFDLSSIPNGATITDVQLTLELVKVNSSASNVTLHKVLTDWGEGTSNAGTGQGSGGGAPATTGDATWVHAFYNTINWATLGGDFDNNPSATLSVDGLGTYTWSDANLIADVQAWLSDSTQHHGWLLKGDESASGTSKSFGSKDNATPGNRPTLEVTYTLPSVPLVDVSAVRTIDNNGVATELGNDYALRGIVHGPDFNGGAGYSFTLIDGTGGINVVSSADVDGYIVSEGDSIHIEGTIQQTNGLIQIVPTSIILASQNNNTIPPLIVSNLGENTESDVVKLENVTLVAPSQWTNTAPSFNVQVRNGIDTFEVVIDDDSDLFGQNAPQGWFNLIGIGGQSDAAAPYTEGYLLMPRYGSDIELVSFVEKFNRQAFSFQIFPNPTIESLSVITDATLESIIISDGAGRNIAIYHNPNTTPISINVSPLKKGLYYITLVTKEGLWTESFIKK